MTSRTQEISDLVAKASMGTGGPMNSERGRPFTVSFSGDFRGRTQLVKVARQAVVGMLTEAGCDREAQSVGMIAAQELGENLVKYSRTAESSLTAHVHRLGSQHVEICFETENDASPEEIARVQALLAEVSVREVPDSLYQQRIASSSSRSRSELGLLRILTEASMSLELRVEGERVYLEAQSSSLNLAPTRTSGAKLAAASKESGSR
jgi:hypothetical protein